MDTHQLVMVYFNAQYNNANTIKLHLNSVGFYFLYQFDLQKKSL